MAKIYNNKIIMTLNEKTLDAYAKAIEDSEKVKLPFKNEMEALNNEFKTYLIEKRNYALEASSYYFIVSIFIDFIYFKTDVTDIGEITKGMANSYFRKWYRSKVLNNDASDYELKRSIYLFFNFLAEEKNILNEKVLNSFD